MASGQGPWVALPRVGLLVALPVTLVNVCWASGPDRTVACIASRSDGRSSVVGPLSPLESVLPWSFLALCTGSAWLLILRGRFGMSAALLTLHVAHLSLLLLLLLVQDSFRVGAGLWQVVRNLSERLVLGVAVMLSVPFLARRCRRC